MLNAATTEDFTPFFFGDPEKPLFGMYHTPNPGTTPRDGVVVQCSSVAGEFVHAHRTHRQLGARLARAGLASLRFDYYGSGDSAGEDTEANLDQWLEDTRLAIAEAQRRSGSQRVILVGLRFGAAVAALAAAQRNDVAGLVLWEPAVSGQEFWDDITEWDQHKMRYFLTQPAQPYTDSLTERLGSIFSQKMVQDIQQVDLLKLTRKPAQSVLLVESQEHEPVKALSTNLEGLGSAVEYLQLDGPIVWRDDPDKALVPHQILQAIVGWMSTL